jgi:hypothetical protein
MKSKHAYKRVSKPIKGSEKAMAARSHALPQADEMGKKANPQRLDLIRRNMLSTRKKDN